MPRRLPALTALGSGRIARGFNFRDVDFSHLHQSFEGTLGLRPARGDRANEKRAASNASLLNQRQIVFFGLGLFITSFETTRTSSMVSGGPMARTSLFRRTGDERLDRNSKIFLYRCVDGSSSFARIYS